MSSVSSKPKPADSDFMAALARRQAMESGKVWANRIPFEDPNDNVIVFLGSGRDASNKEKLLENNVTHILNVADDVENFWEKEKEENGERMFCYCNLNVKDFGADAGISRVFKEAVKFIRGVNGAAGRSGSGGGGDHGDADDNVAAGEKKPAVPEETNAEAAAGETDADNTDGNDATAAKSSTANGNRPSAVLVHCANGSNRSVSVVIAAKMIIDKCSLEQAFRIVKDNHQRSMPLQDNRKQLMQFERKLYPGKADDEYMDGRVFFDRKKKWKQCGTTGEWVKNGEEEKGEKNGDGKNGDGVRSGGAEKGDGGQGSEWKSDANAGTICQS